MANEDGESAHWRECAFPILAPRLIMHAAHAKGNGPLKPLAQHSSHPGHIPRREHSYTWPRPPAATVVAAAGPQPLQAIRLPPSFGRVKPVWSQP
jgi:hypothetical protein